MVYKNILLIDDDPDDQEIVSLAIETLSYPLNFTALSSAVEAMDMLRARELDPDLILLDLNMPLMNGQQFLRAIKKEDGLREIPVIILSTSSHKATIELTKELGAADFFSKPAAFDEMVSILKSIVLPGSV